MSGVLLAGALAFYGISNHLFWDDEANTAIFARNLLAHGELTAWDGTNLIAYRNGLELDENLVNNYIPPLQYYVTAVSFYLFGETTFAARLPFALFGIGTVALLFGIGRRFGLGPKVAVVACFVLGLNVQYLLYIRNCRYYSIGVFFTVALVYFFLYSTDRKNRPWIAHLGIALCVWGLFFTSYFNAASAVLFLPLFFLFKDFRQKPHLVRLGNAAMTAAIMGSYALVVRNPFGSQLARREHEAGFSEHFFGIFSYYLRDIGLFEFFPILLVPVLALPWFVKKLRPEVQVAKRALFLLLFFVISISVTAAFTPQPYFASRSLFSDTDVVFADMRYVVSLIPIGAIVAATALFILWRFAKPLAVIVAGVLIFSNTLYLGFLNIGDKTLKPRGLTCTLCDYVYENTYPVETGEEKIVAFLKTKPEVVTVNVKPLYMSYSPMFYEKDRIYTRQICPSFKVHPDKKEFLPSYVYKYANRNAPDLLLRSYRNKEPLETLRAYRGQYRAIAEMDFVFMNTSRPELRWHGFTQEEVEAGHHRTMVFYEREE